MPRLQVLNGKRQGSIFEIAAGSDHVIGHRHTASITIDDPWVSWDHARLFFKDGSCWVEDLGSTNGTFVNCERVKRQILRHEDIVFLGKTHVIFLSPVEEHGGGALFDGSSGSQAGLLEAGGPEVPVLGASSALQSAPLAPLSMPSSGGWYGEESDGGPFDDPELMGGGRDPFSESAVDPFSSGPDYASFFKKASGSHLIPRAAILEATGPGRQDRSLAETSHDANAPNARDVDRPLPTGGFRLQELAGSDPGELPTPSSREIRSLIDGSARLSGPDDSGWGGNLDEVGVVLEPAHPGAPLPPEPGSVRGAVSSVESLPVPEGPPEDLGQLAFERARLEDTVRRLRMALQAAQGREPAAVQRAAEVLRDQELARQARRIAELEQSLVELREEGDRRQAELDAITEEMIEKEDAIDALRDEVSRLRAASPGESHPDPHGMTSHDEEGFASRRY